MHAVVHASALWIAWFESRDRLLPVTSQL